MNTVTKNSKKLRKLATTGILCGVMLFLAFTDVAVISIPPANMSFCCVPIIVGTLLCGLDTGIILSLIFGISSVVKAFTAPSVLVLPLMGVSPAYVIIMSVGARLLIPVFTHLVYKAFKKHKKAGTAVSSLVGAVTNTVFYLGLMLLFYTMAGLDSAAVLGVIAGVGALNGSLEAAAAVIVCTPVVIALQNAFSKKQVKEA